MKELSKAYNPQEFEADIYRLWEEQDLFNPDTTHPDGEPYSILMPPPNVTGVLHLGHALENALMDIMTRYQRLQGKRTLLLPGTDHAAVATQAKVERLLVEKGIKNPREEFGRQKLLQEIRTYAEESKSTILSQIRKMGTSCDWSRLAYTFDAERSEAVNEVFYRMYHDGLIYKGYRVVNWSVKGQSTCSDDELVHIEREAKLYTFKYSDDLPFAISTTRPETKLGDTAIAVNPNDERYKKYIGENFIVDVGAIKPLKLKVIADENIDPEFGTGAVGVTPAHSPIDFEMYEKQKADGNPIDLISVIGPDGQMTAEAGPDYHGLDVLAARQKFITWLKDNDLFISEEEISQNVGTSDRFGDVVEALPMTQWFVDVNAVIPNRGKSLKLLMKEAVTTGLDGDKKKVVRVTPKRFEKLYFNWIDNLRDWCISRQIWWGHRIPVWYCRDCQESVVSDAKQCTIILQRHGEADSNANDYLNSDVSKVNNRLTEKGRKQVLAAVKKMPQINAIYSSDMERAKETAEIFAEKLKLEIEYDDRLREVGVGDFEGSPDVGDGFNQTRAKFSAWHHDNPHGIESFDELKTRVFASLTDIAFEHPGETVLVVTHGDIARTAQGLHENISDEDIFHLSYPDTGESFEIKITPVTCECGSHDVYQDEYTLDTWFSSGLWPFSTLGWPNNSHDLKDFFPTSWMQMGYEIIFFWMARMILMSSYTLNEIPFKDVYIHGMLRDEKGQKFSKSAGNGIDPVEIAEKYGTDALRLSLISGVTPGNDSRFYLEKVESNRNFINKLWNISRYIFMSSKAKYSDSVPSHSAADDWILSRLNRVIDAVNQLFADYNFSQAAELLREFTRDDFADWYLEIAKVEKKKDDILIYILNNLLRLWHPFIPFVTEAIWRSMGEKSSVMVSSWPKVKSAIVDQEFEAAFAVIPEAITKIRNVRAEYRIDPGKKIPLRINSNAKETMLADNLEIVKALARLDSIEFVSAKPDRSASVVIGPIELYIPLAEVIDIDQEKERLSKELEDIKKYVNSVKKKLDNKSFVDNAPKSVVAGEQVKYEEAEQKMILLHKQLEELK
ncbi:hypothetical protein COT97_00090 [Candidatus Falkowbacteria bacterium CG10_big_fil_rev_8_21_14_0_10_39_11]|uniref:Valine--tRNA ligase n=1 Tax=Candidatus Falkowbacteria bacterium CG10_big_fil_rev_8_21_14_0_10_39_11 TaxID=1974565 RepID=A0A2H0V6B2_9BACT|nr:MAG: hypothetical protein COT97_00090 [Candidatus Falkowbacteria bacterium CG10_big_fil_rev_8_21_14_0_10_39_11]